MDSYDYIIVGAGAAGLLLADALGRDPFFAGHSILLLEKEANKENDRTWCFWETAEGPFDPLLSHSWERLMFAGQAYADRFSIAPYRYKMLRGADFYREYERRILKAPNIRLHREEVTAIREKEDRVVVQTRGGRYTASSVFSSLFSWKDLLAQTRYPVLQQHFVGWFIRAQSPVFQPEEATFMDFSVPQKGNTRFMYVLPFSEREALVEYTLFSPDLLENAEYEAAIRHYLQNNLKCQEYTILEKEMGRIPMSCYDFTARNTNRILHIGVAGGWAKPGTGYTFMNSRRKVAALLDHLKKGKSLSVFGKRTRFWWYDLLLLDILQRDNAKGRLIFESLFRKRKASLILRFLDEQTSLWEDLRVIWACPKKDFFMALLRRIF